jgi:hypothetical protein
MAKETYNPYGLIPAYPDDARIEYYPVAASQTIAKGDPVIISSGQIAIATTTSAEICGVAAQASASADAGTLIAIYDDPDTVFFVRADADASSLAIGTHCDLDGSTGAFQLDVAGSTYDILNYLGTKPNDDNSEIGAHLKVRINKHTFADISA